jgi:hypothetical protein
MEGMTRRQSTLSDPEQAAFAWRRYRRLMAWMTLAAALAVLAALAYLKSALGALPLPIILATIAGIGLSVVLAGALMGLVFLSSGTGHDQDVADFEENE